MQFGAQKCYFSISYFGFEAESTEGKRGRKDFLAVPACKGCTSRGGATVVSPFLISSPNKEDELVEKKTGVGLTHGAPGNFIPDYTLLLRSTYLPLELDLLL